MTADARVRSHPVPLCSADRGGGRGDARARGAAGWAGDGAAIRSQLGPIGPGTRRRRRQRASGSPSSSSGCCGCAPDRGPVRALRQLYRDTLRPLFARVSLVDIVVISVLAGVGEELLFRGAVQAAWGPVVASVLFGLCHIGGRATVALGLWAALVGAFLGWLATVTRRAARADCRACALRCARPELHSLGLTRPGCLWTSQPACQRRSYPGTKDDARRADRSIDTRRELSPRSSLPPRRRSSGRS